MNPKKIISVVICTYNRPKLLHRAVDSCLNQTFDKSRMQLIIIDDHTDDNGLTQSAIDSYKTQYPDMMKAYYNEENLGPGGSRNKAIGYLDTKYVLFLDDDDFLVPDAIESLIDIAVEYETDLVEFETQNFDMDSDGNIIDRVISNRRPFDGFIEYHSPSEKLDYFFETSSNYYSRLYLSDLLLKNKIRFTPNAIYEEPPFVLFSRMAAFRVYHLQKVMIKIFNNPSSLIHGFSKNKSKFDNLIVWENASKYFLNSAFKETYYSHFIILFILWYVRMSYFTLIQRGFEIDPETSLRILSFTYDCFPEFEKDIQDIDERMLSKIGLIFQIPYPGLPDDLSIFNLMFTLVTAKNMDTINGYLRKVLHLCG